MITNEVCKYNEQLIEKYPWLLPRNVWTDEIAEDYDFSYTLLDDMPTGWRVAFGEKMCAEIQAALEKMKDKNAVNQFRVVQIKEKFGQLRFYTNFYTKEIDEVIDKYTELSGTTCITCGEKATRISTGWISPFCDACADNIKGKTIPIEEFFSNP